MRVAITGASGLIGSAVVGHLRAAGHEVTRLVRSRPSAARPDAAFWNPETGDLDEAALRGRDAVINMAGENIFGLWTAGKKRRIRESRVEGTRLLATRIAALPAGTRPAALVNASAVGYYGDRPPDEPLGEDASPGDSFMARVVRDWEAALAPAEEAGVRAIALRFGVVLDPGGALLKGMATAGRLGLAARVGDGRQVLPWVTRDEIARVVPFVLTRPEIRGPVNVVAPERVTNEGFADAVAGVLRRPRFLAVPAPIMRLLGDFGRELLSGAWVVPRVLERAGYGWRDPELEPSLRRMLRS